MTDNPKLRALLGDMLALSERKNQDYAQSGNPFSNFEEAAQVAEGFTGVDAVFAVLIGIKLARLRELTRAGKSPANESVMDTRIDLANYAALWAAYKLPWTHDDSRAHGRSCGCGKSVLVNGARCRECEAVASEQ